MSHLKSSVAFVKCIDTSITIMLLDTLLKQFRILVFREISLIGPRNTIFDHEAIKARPVHAHYQNENQT